MQPEVLERIEADPAFQELVARRRRVSYALSFAVLMIFFGYVAVVAFWPEALTARLTPGMVTTVGMPVALVTLLLVVVCTGYYVHLANARFDRLIENILRNINR